MVVADRVLEEIFCGLFVGEADELLGAAEVRGLSVFNEFSFLGEESGQVSGNLEDGYRAFLHIAPDSHADAGLEVSVELIAFHHIQRNGAVGEKDFSLLDIDSCRIGLEAGLAGKASGDNHGQHCRGISLTACHIAFRVQFGESQTSGVPETCEKVEAPDCKSVESVAICN